MIGPFEVILITIDIRIKAGAVKIIIKEDVQTLLNFIVGSDKFDSLIVSNFS